MFRRAEGDDDDLGVAEFSDAIADRDGVLLAGQSSQVAMEDQHHRPAPVIVEPPPPATMRR
jgi:hypothetical protein